MLITYIKLYFLTLPIFLGVDLVWLVFVARKFYQSQIGSLMSDSPRLAPALIFYLLFIVALVVFIVYPALEKKSLAYAVFAGGLFGMVSYATYDLTNLATLKNWPLTVTIVDLIWGTVLAASVSAVAYLLASKLNIFS